MKDFQDWRSQRKADLASALVAAANNNAKRNPAAKVDEKTERNPNYGFISFNYMDCLAMQKQLESQE